MIWLEKNQDYVFNGNESKIIDSITVNRKPSLDNENSIKKYIRDEINKNTILSFNQTEKHDHENLKKIFENI